MLTIRSFRNSDLPSLVAVWQSYWNHCGCPALVTASIIERAILARTFFVSDQLLIAESDRQVVGWCHIVETDGVANSANLNGLCVMPEHSAAIAHLLEAAESKAQSDGKKILQAGILRDEVYGYAGLSPLGAGVGVCKVQAALNEHLAARSYQAGLSLQQLTISTQNYRPPVNRQAMQLRRTTKRSIANKGPESTRIASAMSHLDVERHSLLAKSGEEKLAEVEVWFSDPEAEVMPPSQAIVNMNRCIAPDGLSPEQSYLMCELLESLNERHVISAEIVIDADKQIAIDQLVKLGFNATNSGGIWQKSL